MSADGDQDSDYEDEAKHRGTASLEQKLATPQSPHKTGGFLGRAK